MTLALTLIAALALLELASLAFLIVRRTVGAGPRLTGRTVVLERSGVDVVNVRGVVVAEHEDRWTLAEAQAVHPHGDVPLEHPIIHVPKTVVLSISEVPAVRR